MSVASEIERIQTAKANLKTSINAKNNNQHQITTETIDDYADFVDTIQTSGGSTKVLKPIVDYNNGSGTVNYISGVGTTGSLQLGTLQPSSTVPNDIIWSLVPNKKGFIFGFVRSNYTLSNNVTLLAETDWFSFDTTNQKMFVCWSNDLTQTFTFTQETSARYEIFAFVVSGVETPTSADIVLNTTIQSDAQTNYYTVSPTNKACIYFISTCYNITNPTQVRQMDMNFSNIWLTPSARLTLYVSYDNTVKNILTPATGAGIIGIELN